MVDRSVLGVADRRRMRTTEARRPKNVNDSLLYKYINPQLWQFSIVSDLAYQGGDELDLIPAVLRIGTYVYHGLGRINSC